MDSRLRENKAKSAIDAEVGRSWRTKLWSPDLGIWALASIILVWLMLLPRVIPRPVADRGIFISVAERLLVGDVLYQDVWDNKDPLFFFSIAIGRIISPYADFVFELGWIACSVTAVFVLAQWKGCNRATALFLALGAAPLILTGGFYLPGHTHLPGTALTLGVLAAALSLRFGLAGTLFAVLVFTKIVMVPVAFLGLLVVFLVCKNWHSVLRTAIGFTAAGAVVLCLLFIRGELQPYVQSLLLNISYAQGSQIQGKWGPFLDHLARVSSWNVFLVASSIILMAAWAFWANKRSLSPTGLDKRNLTLCACVGSTLLGAIAVLGITGMWHHHNQIFYVPGILAIISVVHRLQPVFNVHSGLSVLAFICMAACLSGPLSSEGYTKSLTSMRHALASLGRVSPEALSVLSVADNGTYARVGQNDDFAHAYGLGGWDLICPRFHQYPFDSPKTLEGVLECLPMAEVIIVSSKAVPVEGNAMWNSYISNVEAMLDLQYSCKETQAGRVCVRQKA